MLSRIPANYFGLLALIIWGAALLSLGLLRFDPYALSEGGAKAMLLAWTIADNVRSPVATFGLPDLRTLPFTFVSLYWPGSIVAVKIVTMLFMAAIVFMLHRWGRSDEEDQDTALIAAALLLICPLTISQIDSVGAGPYLLLAFVVGAWVDRTYRASQHPMGGWYFSQLLIVAMAVSIHPVGLAYPVMVAWWWFRNPPDRARLIQMIVGIAVTLVLVLPTRQFWGDEIAWLSNPLVALGGVFQNAAVAMPGSDSLAAGAVVVIVLLVVLFRDRRFLTSDLLGSTLLTAMVIGLLAADTAWALLALVLILYRGLPLLSNATLRSTSFAGQKGLLMVVALIVSTVFMVTDKGYAHMVEDQVLSPQDTFIKRIAEEAAETDTETPFRVASQWPARTMIASRRDVFPLPKAAADGQALLASIKGITHMIFDHTDPKNRALVDNIAEVSGIARTLEVGVGVVAIRVVDDSGDGAESAPPVATP